MRNPRNMLRGLAFFVATPHPAFTGSRISVEEGDREGFGAKDGGGYIEFPKSALGFSGKDDTRGLLVPNELATLNQRVHDTPPGCFVHYKTHRSTINSNSFDRSKLRSVLFRSTTNILYFGKFLI